MRPQRLFKQTTLNTIKMSSLRIMDMLKLTFKVLEYKYEQRKLTSSEYQTIETDKGSIKGVRRATVWGDSYISFEGIPYAQPPLGELRFKAPQPATAWQGIKDCTYPGQIPMQSNVLFRKYKGSEDCLYLNVYTKNLKPEKPRPVMVWIFGGGFQIGEATRDMYGPDFFMSKDVVLVTVSYRLGAFGFLSLDDPSLNVPGNAGLKDQIMSLHWVQQNIAAFGGNINNVTLFGESAGGAGTHFCMLSEQSKGLIHKGIVMSGSALCPWALPPRNQWAYRLAKVLGYKGEQKCKDIHEFLQNCAAPDIVKATANVLSKEEKHDRILFAFGPTVEPYVTEQCILSEQPRKLMESSWSNQIPMMIGGTSFEGLLFLPEVTRRPATLDEVRNCANLLPQDLELCDQKIKAEYGLQIKSAHFGEEICNMQNVMKFLELESYREFWHPIYRTALCRSNRSAAPTYLYRFDYDSEEGNSIRNVLCGRGVRGTCHGDDLCYLYAAMFCYRYSAVSEEGRVARTMIDIWTNFAANSNPNCQMLGNISYEPLKQNEEFKCLNISDKLEFISLPELPKLGVWSSFYPQGKL